MANSKIQTLNNAVKEALPHMRDVARENPNAQVMIRVLKFGDHPTWDRGNAVELENFSWQDLAADQGMTALGRALKELASQLKMPPMPERQLPPVLILLSDGQPTDDFRAGLRDLMAEPWAQHSIRLAIAIGKDADRAVLQEFIGHLEIKPLEAKNPEALTQYILWASTQAIKSASSGGTSGGTVINPNGIVPLPVPPSANNQPPVW